MSLIYSLTINSISLCIVADKTDWAKVQHYHILVERLRKRSHTQQRTRFGHGTRRLLLAQHIVQVKFLACSKVHWLYNLEQWRTSNYLRLALRRRKRSSCQPSCLAMRGTQAAMMVANTRKHTRAHLIPELHNSCALHCVACRAVADVKRLGRRDAEDKASRPQQMVAPG